MNISTSKHMTIYVHVGEATQAKRKELCADHAVFYHSYSFAALLYEARAAAALVLA